MDIKKNEKGITFVSMLLTIVIIIITLPFMGHLISTIHVSTFEEDLSVQQFFVFLRNDVIEARHIYSENNRLFFKLKSGETATIELYTDVIRRQIDGRGHEVYLRDIESMHLQQLNYGFKINVTTLKGETFEKKIVYYDE